MALDWQSRLCERFGDEVDVHTVPARPEVSESIPDWLHSELTHALAQRGIHHLWSHQAEALRLTRERRDTVVATGTASGKSLCYQLPMVQAVLESPNARALYIAPTKALAHDQVRSLTELDVPGVAISAYDGDSDSAERRYARDYAAVVVTNPDMVHHGLLPGHDRWRRFLGQLAVIAVDECHLYRGVFGSHVANVLRRLIRLAELHGATPTIVMASATVTAPARHAQLLCGRDFTEVTIDGSPRGPLTIALALPRPMVGQDWHGEELRRSAIAETADALCDLVCDGVRTLAFVRSRKAAETVALIAREHLREVSPTLLDTVTSYRAGYLPEERRDIEARLREGRLLGVATTNALELGVDISGLDASLIAGWPGSRASFWQQVGRAGRSGQDAFALMIASDNPMDHYLVHHPEAVYDQPVESAVCDPGNREVLTGHLGCAAAESHLTEQDLPRFGSPDQVRDVLDQLCAGGVLRQRPNGWFWAAEHRAHERVDIRGVGLSAYQIVVSQTGQLIGTVDADAAFRQVHEGAIYLHLGETFLVDTLDIANRVALVDSFDADYATYARSTTTVDVVESQESVQIGMGRLHRGIVDVTEQVVSFQKRRNLTAQVLGEVPLDLPPQTLRTQAVWWTVPQSILAEHGIHDVAGCVHAAEHAAIGLLPLFTMCDRNDIGGVSMAEHPDTGVPTVFVYDGYTGGAGFTWHGYTVARDWLAATRDTIADCRCATGCPGCVQSPKCGNNNHPLDKAAARVLLDCLVGT